MQIWVCVIIVWKIQNFMTRRTKMKDSRYYFLLGFMTAILVAMVVVGCTSPLEAGSSEIGSSEWNPMYVKIVD